ncbi:hypothetical protein BDD12DRAFT_807605 [Trichophaea hybrida]|nr:hypothetical protein BDD12DRAFT_807605 [Trichophaea hybrida]
MAIDIWALGCTLWVLLGQWVPFTSAFTLQEYVTDMFTMLGGEKNVPERFWKAFYERGGAHLYDTAPPTTCDEKLKFLRGGMWKGKPVPAGKDDKAFLRKIIESVLVVEPKQRVAAAAIVEMMPEGWEDMSAPVELLMACIPCGSFNADISLCILYAAFG